MSDDVTGSTMAYFAASDALSKALGLDPDDADTCVPGCTEGPAGLEHDIWHLTQQRDEAQAVIARVRAKLDGMQHEHYHDGYAWDSECQACCRDNILRALDGAET